MATTPHNHGPNFGRRVSGCPRCDELNSGAKPVQSYGARADAEARRFRAALAAHSCVRSGCGAICTFGDW